MDDNEYFEEKCYEAWRDWRDKDGEDSEDVDMISGHPKFNWLLQEMAELHARKDHDYAGDEHLSNFKECEKFDIPAWKGVLVRLSDKWSRVKSLVKKGGNKVEDESLIDTLMDISVYALITIILLEEAERDTQAEEKAC